MNWYKSAQVYGEWWITDTGQALFANDDYNHEGHVQESIAYQYFELDRIDSPDVYEIMNMSDAELAEVGMEPDEIRALKGQMDAREFAIKNWGWVRVANHYVQAWVLDSRTLQRIANGLFDAFDSEVLKSTFVLENLSSGKNYSSVPYEVIEQANPMALRAYQEWEPLALGEHVGWYKSAYRSISLREMFSKLRRMGIIIEDAKKGWTLRNPATGGVTAMHFGQIHGDIAPGMFTRIMRELGIDKNDFYSGKKIEMPVPETEKGIPDYQKQPWFIEQQRRTNMGSNNWYKRAIKERIPGGRAEGKDPSKYDKKQMEMGEQIEYEHTPDPAVAREIARDHLEEFDNYYTGLDEMEKKLKKQKEKK